MKFSFSSLLAVVIIVAALAFGLSAIADVHGTPLAITIGLAVLLAVNAPTIAYRLGAGSSVFSNNLADIDLNDTPALPNGNATTYSKAFKLGPGVHPDDIEIEITIPSATTGEAPDTRTLTVDIVAGDTTTPTTGASLQTVYTGAGGAGFTGSVLRTKIASTAGDYIRLRMAGGASFGNMSGKTATIRILQ